MPINAVSEGQADLLALDIARTPPNVPVAESPPGKTLLDLPDEDLHLVLIAVEGMTHQIQLARQTQRQGSTAYLETSHLIGRVVTIGNQLRRYLERPAPAA